MEQDQIISSLFNMLQKSNNEKINMQLTIDKLTMEIDALKKEDKKANKKNEEAIMEAMRSGEFVYDVSGAAR